MTNKLEKTTRFIEEQISETMSLSEFISKFSAFCTKNKLDPSDFIVILNERGVLYKLAERIYDENKKKITEGYLEKIFDDDVIITLINCFCMINKIELKDDDDLSLIGDIISNNNYKLYMNDVNSCPTLSEDERFELALKIKEGDELAKKNLLSVI